MTRDDRRRTTGSRRMTRRRWLRGAAATTGAAVAGGLPGILAHAQAPAAPQGTRLHLLQWSHFVPAADTLFEQQAAEFGKQAGVRGRRSSGSTRTTSRRASPRPSRAETGPDIIIIANNHPLLYETALVGRVATWPRRSGGRQGGWYDYAKVNCLAGGRWIGVPQFIISWAITYREDWFKEAGLEYPKTWDEFRNRRPGA